MRFSIVTPSYNQAPFIEETIHGVLEQGRSDVEHIIIDGGSTDGTLDILKKYQHLRWLSEPDNGQSDAINKGFRMAKGEILAWINSDDYYLAGAFKKVLRAFDNVRKPDIVMGDVLAVDAHDKVIAKRRVFPYDYRMLLFGTNYIHQPAVFFSRRTLEKAGYLDESLHYVMDWDLWLRFGEAGLRFKAVYTPLACLRWHGAAKSVASYSRLAADCRAVRDRYWYGERKQRSFANSLFLAFLRAYYILKVQAVRFAYRGTVDFPLRFIRTDRHNIVADGSTE